MAGSISLYSVDLANQSHSSTYSLMRFSLYLLTRFSRKNNRATFSPRDRTYPFTTRATINFHSRPNFGGEIVSRVEMNCAFLWNVGLWQRHDHDRSALMSFDRILCWAKAMLRTSLLNCVVTQRRICQSNPWLRDLPQLPSITPVSVVTFTY